MSPALLLGYIQRRWRSRRGSAEVEVQTRMGKLGAGDMEEQMRMRRRGGVDVRSIG